MQFEIILKNEKERTYRMITLLFVVLHVLYFTYLLFDKVLWRRGITGLSIIALYTLYRLIISKTTSQRFYFGAGFFFPFAIFSNQIWLMIVDGILLGICAAALQKKSVYFNSHVVEYKAFSYKRYKWNDFSNILLKDNILTLDFKNNKLLQAEIDPAFAPDERIFNQFASEQLLKHN